MSMQGKKRASDDASTANASTMKEALTDAKKFIEQIFNDIENMPIPLPTNMELINNLKERRRKMEECFKKKFTVGVLGVTGAGKSSLVNAVLGEKKLLPSGSIDACTSVIIRVEANMTNSNYEAEIEFISKEEWEKELDSLLETLAPDSTTEKDRQSCMIASSKIKALYGDDGVGKNLTDLMEIQSITEILEAGKKNLSHDNALEFSNSIDTYIRSKSKGEGTQYWPLVKCVTIKVPNSQEILENIVLVDVPGKGDWNKARDKMWETEINNCSSVWVVADIDRVASENAAWSILDRSMNNLGPGGQCCNISFICTKTDNISRRYELEIKDGQAVPVQAEDHTKNCILDRNKRAKKSIEDNVSGQYEKFGEFEVFTVSSDEFQENGPILSEEETEIPKLRALLKKLNTQQSKELVKKYLWESHQICMMIQMANSNTRQQGSDTKKSMEQYSQKVLEEELEKIRQFLSDIHDTVKSLLINAIPVSEETCVQSAMHVISPVRNRSGYHKTLKALCKNQGLYRSKDERRDFNDTLAKTMHAHIEEYFEEVFPTNGKSNGKSIYCKITGLNILSSSHQAPEKFLHPLHVEYIKVEQQKLKSKLNEDIVQKKKKVFSTLRESIKTSMEPAYDKAARMRGTGSMNKMQCTLENHIDSQKKTMFLKAMNVMLDHLKKLGDDIVSELKKELMDAMMQPFTIPINPALPDVSEYLQKIKEALQQFDSTSE